MTRIRFATCLTSPMYFASDVDNMRSKAGTSATDKASFERLIDGIQVMIVILTGSVRDGVENSDYFMSIPCRHELSRAQENGTPVVFVRESARPRRHSNVLLPWNIELTKIIELTECAHTRPLV